MNFIVKVSFIAVLVLVHAAGTKGLCYECSESEFCHSIFWFFSRCIRYRVEDDRCDNNHRICGQDLKCTKGTCQSLLRRTKSLTTSTSSTVKMSPSTTTNIVTTTSKPKLEVAQSPTSVFATAAPPKAKISTDIAKTISEIVTTTSVAVSGTSAITEPSSTNDNAKENLI